MGVAATGAGIAFVCVCGGGHRSGRPCLLLFVALLCMRAGPAARTATDGPATALVGNTDKLETCFEWVCWLRPQCLCVRVYADGSRIALRDSSWCACATTAAAALSQPCCLHCCASTCTDAHQFVVAFNSSWPHGSRTLLTGCSQAGCGQPSAIASVLPFTHRYALQLAS